MADEKIGNDASNAQNSVNPAGTPPSLGGVPVSPDVKPPVLNVMPHEAMSPSDPMVVPPHPPVTNMMPPAPELKIDVGMAPPNYADLVSSTKLPEKPLPEPPLPAPSAVPSSAPAAPAKPPTAPVQDAIEAEVGLVRPAPKATPPDPLRTDISKILKDVKLPEKRSFSPSGEKKPAVSQPGSAQQLDAVLAARITENSSAGPAVVAAASASQPSESMPPPNAGTVHVPEQQVFHEETAVEAVHTLKQDLQHVVREQKMSVVRAVALEQEKKRPDRIDIEPQQKSRAPAILATVFTLIVVGLAALGGVYYVATMQSTPGEAVRDDAIVFAEQTVAFELTPGSPLTVKSNLAQARNAGGTLGSLMHIVPVVSDAFSDGTTNVRKATLVEFFSSIDAHPPESLLRALGQEFFFGIHTVDKNAPILVIQVTSYDRAFDGMLSWEKGLNGDLAPIFSSVPRLVMGSDGIQVERPFVDLVMRNYDVRALKDDSGVIQMYYSFPTRDLLIIAESPYTFTEILSRLQAGRRL